MSSRVRQSTMEPTQRRGGSDLPPYERPAFPLSREGQIALERLNRTHKVNDLDKALQEAITSLGVTAGEINDRLTDKERAQRKDRKRRDQVGSEEAEGQNDLERDIEAFKDKVERMTTRMEEDMRKMIDAQHSVQSLKDSVVSTHREARENADTQASMQQARTQQYEDFQPTDPAAGAQDKPSPIEIFRAKNEDAKLKYQSNTLTARYAKNNDYRNFRRVVNDAKHPDGDVQLPHEDEWFPDGPAPAPGMTSRTREDEDDDSDVDIAVSRAKISTTCPLTLAEFKKPLTSTKCPHSFESEAILSIIRRSDAGDPARGNVQVHQCPVGGCSQMLAATDLKEDQVLVRQIKRLQAAKEREQEEDDEDDEDDEDGNGATVIEDGDDAEDVDDIIEGRSTQVKKEPRTQRGISKTPRSTARGSAATPMQVDDGDETDGDEDMVDASFATTT